MKRAIKQKIQEKANKRRLFAMLLAGFLALIMILGMALPAIMT